MAKVYHDIVWRSEDSLLNQFSPSTVGLRVRLRSPGLVLVARMFTWSHLTGLTFVCVYE